ncbi:MAG: hypothetical protein AAGF98_05080 [Cyanobacteria bacterium P01_H01_bin.153]
MAANRLSQLPGSLYVQKILVLLCLTKLPTAIDLLVVEESDLRRFKRSPRDYKALMSVFPTKDITVWTPAEIQAWSALPNAFIMIALREGNVLYEEPAFLNRRC